MKHIGHSAPILLGALGITSMLFYLLTSAKPLPVALPVSEPAGVAYHHYLAGAGLTEPNSESIAIGPHIQGVVSHIYVEVGDPVTAGQPLFEIDTREIDAKLVKTKAVIRQRQIEVAEAQDRLSIIEKIKDQRAISQDERNQNNRAVEIAEQHCW